MSNTYHMPKVLNIHLWGMHANISTTYEVALMIDVGRITVHGRCQMMTMTRRTMPQPIVYNELAICVRSHIAFLLL